MKATDIITEVRDRSYTSGSPGVPWFHPNDYIELLAAFIEEEGLLWKFRIYLEDEARQYKTHEQTQSPHP